jgi:hypothetical protein
VTHRASTILLMTIAGMLAVAIAVVVLMTVQSRSDREAGPAAETSQTPPAESSAPPESSAPAAPAPPDVPNATCENIMDAAFATDWTPRVVEPASVEPLLAEGISCIWAADHSVGTDNVLVYSWAPLSASAWNAFTAERLAEENGWLLEHGDRGTYLTTLTDYWVQDDEGYGHTYLFTGDAVVVAMTKAETDMVVGPRA